MFIYSEGVKLKIICLIEDNIEKNSDMICEHGLAIYIETNGLNILFDTGATGIFVKNVDKMNLSLENLDLGVISHGHYDHGGGLESLLKLNKTAPIYLRKSANEDYFLKYLVFFKKYIGLDKIVLSDNSHRIHFINRNIEIKPGIHLITDIKNKYPFPGGSKYLYKRKGNELKKDDFSHELMVVIDEKDGIIIISGCSHHGILNMVETAMDLFPGKNIKAVFGGFHLIGSPLLKNMGESKDVVHEIGKKLMEYPIEKVYTCHCTGEKAYNILKEVMEDKLEYFTTPTTVTF